MTCVRIDIGDERLDLPELEGRELFDRREVLRGAAQGLSIAQKQGEGAISAVPGAGRARTLTIKELNSSKVVGHLNFSSSPPTGTGSTGTAAMSRDYAKRRAAGTFSSIFLYIVQRMTGSRPRPRCPAEGPGGEERLVQPRLGRH